MRRHFSQARYSETAVSWQYPPKTRVRTCRKRAVRRGSKKDFEAKGRPQDNPLIVHVTDISEVTPLVKSIPDEARRLAERFWPGPLTMIMPKSDLIPDETSGGLSTVAVRCPSHPVARAIIRAAGVPLAAPSANISGRPSPTNAKYVF